MAQRRPAVSPRACSTRRAAATQAQSASHQVRLVGGLAAETVGSFDAAGSDATPLRVCVVPGNPGVAAYYADFVDALQLELGPSASVCGESLRCALPPCAPRLTLGHAAALGLLGHSRQPLHARTFDLEEQVAHTVRFVDESTADGTRLVLCGHSIGAWLALRALRERPDRVHCVVGLYPFLLNNPASRLQRVLAAAVRLRPLVWLVAQCTAVLGLLPARWRRGLLGPLLRRAGLEATAIAIACDGLRASSVQNTCVLGAAEFAALAAEPDWAALQQDAARVALFYSPVETHEPAHDIWAPPAHAALVRRHAPGVTVVEDAAHGHMFCTTAEGSRSVAAATAALVRSLTSRVAEPAGAR